MKRTLDAWLDYQLHTHQQAIAMGLDRVREVARRLAIGKPGKYVITIGGTNGKGSTVAFVEAIARAAGLRVGAFTSPHLLRYNERIRIDGRDADDAVLIDAFERIEAARNLAGHEAIPLTYFEFGALAALLVSEQSGLDLAILEVGLGGQLDAVNIIDADVAVITTVDLDHQEFLGTDREMIGAEKAGIMRTGKPVVLGEKDPPSSVLKRAYELGAIAIRGHSDYLLERGGQHWFWREPGFELELPLPYLVAGAQLDNAAAAIAALRALPIAIAKPAFVAGIANARVTGRLQTIARAPDIVLDVAHNPQAARQLAAWLAVNPKPTLAVFSALRDKDIEAIVGLVDPGVSHWFVAGIHDAGARGLDGAALAARIQPLVGAARVSAYNDVPAALSAATAAAAPDQRILVFGSFHTVADALRAE